MMQAQIYIHIPFCQQKCQYCDFLSAPATKQVQADYVRQLMNEIESCKWVCQVPTIFIGGGTPSILDAEYIQEILSRIYTKFEVADTAEISLEANPGTLTEQKLMTYRKAGVNRLSIGLQSAVDEELRELGRIHTYRQFLESYRLAREEGFHNLNVDIMSALPGQSIAGYQETLEKVCQLHPEHISAYSLIIEEGTPFADRYLEDEKLRQHGKVPKKLPSEEEERSMYEWTKQYLGKQGYHRYEISNYAMPGRECQHNIGYWKRHNYIGFGLGAAGLIDNVRYQNECDLHTYMQFGGKTTTEVLSRQAQMEEFMFLGLRLDQGISKQEFQEIFLETIENVYGDILRRLIDQKLLREIDEHIILTDYGRDISNYVLAEFMF